MFEDIPGKVRLKEFEINAVKELFAKHFLASDHVWLFGSRANLSKRGGDIDLYIETTIPSEQLFNKKMKFLNELCDAIGDQKIDIVINTVNNSLNLPIYAKAVREGVQLL